MPKKLNEFPATAICGNDISSSCLYVSALAIGYAGQYAWLSLLVVAVVLFLFRKVYGEVVGALPLNGGAYNALLNTTSKSTASLAATLTLLSYMATAVISASESMYYIHSLKEGWPVLITTIILLSIFMILTIIGIGESSKVASIIFIFHLISLIILICFCIYYIVENGTETLMDNMKRPLEGGGLITALFFGFSAAMLGISGFESSANYVEDQKKGVFRKTLRNMWIIVSVFNPLIAFLALALVSIPEVEIHKETLLSHMGELSGERGLSYVISIDAAMVLGGAVLTSFVGVKGLVERMALDRILPQYLLKKNMKGSSYRIPILFFLLCLSVLFITEGKLAALAGVYTIAFLSVMALFGFGNFLLKVKRKQLPRTERSSWIGLFTAVLSVIAALIGNLIMNPNYFKVFLEYLIPSSLIVFFMLNRTVLLTLLLTAIKHSFRPLDIFVNKLNKKILRTIEEINSQEFVFFTHNEDIAKLNQVMRYISRNEATKRIKIVSVYEKENDLSTELEQDIKVLDREYPEIKIEYLKIKGVFEPKLIKQLSKEWEIPINFMFIGSPDDKFPYKVSELGGVRLII